MTRAFGLGLALILSFPAVVAGNELAPELFGLQVRRIDFDSPVPLDEPTLRQLLPLQIDEPLEASAVDASVVALKDKGIFADVDVRAERMAGGAGVVFVLEPVSVIDGIRVANAESVEPGLVLRRSRLREGTFLDQAELKGARRRIEALYRDRGFPDARATIETTRDAPDRVLLTIRIDEGEPVRLTELELEVRDDPTLATAARASLPFRETEPWTPGSLEKGRRALLAFFRAPPRRFYEAEVEATERVVGKRATARFTIRPGPSFVVRIQGNRRLSRRALVELVELEERPVVTDGTWFELARRIEDRYRREGHPFVETQVEIVRKETKRVRIQVTEGPRLVIRRVEFSGNESLPDEELRRVVQTQRAGWVPFLGAPGLFLEGVFRSDLDRLREHYRERGHPDATIRDIRYAFPRTNEGEVTLELTIVVREGEPERVGAVRIEGAPDALVTPGERLETRPGEILQPPDVESDRRRLVEALGRLGYPDARAEALLREASEGGTEVVFRLEPGPRVRIGRVRVRGNLFTLDRVILRRVDLARGDLWLPEKVSEAQSRLYRLGLFRSVSMLSEPPDGPQRDLVVRVRERPGGELQYGFGYDTRIGFRNSLTLVHRNLWGTGRRVSLRGDLNLSPDDVEPDEYLVSLGAREPYLLSLPLDGRADVAFQQSTRSIDEFSVERVAISGGVEREIGRRFTATLLLELDDSRIFDVAPDAVLTGRDAGRLRTVSLNPLLVYDGRDDPFVPTRGVFDSVRLSYASQAVGSDVDFLKLIARHSHHVPLPFDMSSVYALRAGIVEPLGSSRTTPLRERFFLGGRTTVRGFGENEIGPEGDQGNPIGGDLLFNTNVELRVPVVGELALAAFFDGGAVYLRDRGVSLRDFRETAGPGLRYQTPIGSLSLDFGFKLDRRPGESVGEFHFTIGNIF